MIKKYGKVILDTLVLIIGVVFSVIGIVYFHEHYIKNESLVLLLLLTLSSMIGIAVISVVMSLSSKNKAGKKAVVSAVLSAGFYAATLWGLSYLIDALIGKGQYRQLAVTMTVTLLLISTGIMTAVCFCRIFEKKVLKRILAAVSLLSFIAGGGVVIGENIIDALYGNFKASAPVISPKKSSKDEEVMINGDFYVSKKGDDSNIGSKDAPFLTVEKAIEEVRKIDKSSGKGITVCIESGEYRVSSLSFTKEDSGTAECPVKYCAYGDGEVVFNGGITLSPEDFRPVTDYPEISERLSEEARQNVVVTDLTRAPYSLGTDDWGKIYAIGSYNTAERYDGDWTGPLYCELFVNDKRQTLSRYPDKDFLHTQEVVKTGLGLESDGALTKVENWYDIRNPEPDSYRVDSQLAERISGWKTLDDVWMFGYWKHDWADASSPIQSFDGKTGIITPKFVSLYGTKTDAPYYFFNVLEELTAQDEWYLDRENGLLCMWKADDFSKAEIDLSLSLEPVINAQADYLTFEGITVKGTRADAVVITGDNNSVKSCLVKNVAGNAILMTGYNNLAYNNEITHTGKGGIIIEGGDTETLKPGNSKADNNYIHDWSEIYMTYQPAVTLRGVGNICSHNEMVNSPHEAVTYSGNNHIVEYNLIHDVCLLSDDASAIYSGRSWVWYGNIIRYNCIYNLGSGEHTPDGIYLDDALSGQKVYGNLLINIPKYGLLIGGGRDNFICNNIIINAGGHPVLYDERARDGALNKGWFTHAYLESGDMWTALYDSPWKSDVWQEAFEQYKDFSGDIADSEKTSFVPNPANSTVSGNLIFDKASSEGRYEGSVRRFSKIESNMMYSLNEIDDVFVDAENGNYNIKDTEKIREVFPDFEELPLDEIGRVK